MTDTIHKDSMIFTSRQSKAADSLLLDVVVVVPVEEFVEEDVVGDLTGDADVAGDEVAATFVMEAELPALLEAVAGMVVGCAVLIIPARLSVTLTLSQSCMAKLLTSKRCQRRIVPVKGATCVEYLLESNPFQWQERETR